MPLTKEQRSRYPRDWKLISSFRRRVIARDRCEFCGIANYSFTKRGTKVVLTVAHLDYNPSVWPARLAALCQACHLSYDMPRHRFSAMVTRYWKEATLKLFQGDE